VISVLGVEPDEVLALITAGIWDRNWYAEHYPDVRESGEDPLLHYFTLGWRELRSPGPGFDARWYSARYGIDVDAAHPAAHFVCEGRKVGFRPRDDSSLGSGGPVHGVLDVELPKGLSGSDANWNLGQAGPSESKIDAPGVASAGLALIDAELALLVMESGAWDRLWYLQEYPDVRASGVDPLLHYLAQGTRELRSPGPLFDARWYSQAYAAAGVGPHPLVHFLRCGSALGFKPRSDYAGAAPTADEVNLLAKEAHDRQQQWCLSEEAILRGDHLTAVSILGPMSLSCKAEWRVMITLSWCLTELHRNEEAAAMWPGTETPRDLRDIPCEQIRLRATLAERALGFPLRSEWPTVEYRRKTGAAEEDLKFRGLRSGDLASANVQDASAALPILGHDRVILGLSGDERSVLVGQVGSKLTVREAPFARFQARRASDVIVDVPLGRLLAESPPVQRQRFIINPGRVGSTLLVRMLREAGVEAVSELEMHRQVAIACARGAMDANCARTLSSAATASVLDEPCEVVVMKLHVAACAEPGSFMNAQDDAVVLWRSIEPWFRSWRRAAPGHFNLRDNLRLLENAVRAQWMLAEAGRLKGVVWYEDLVGGRIERVEEAFDDILGGVRLKEFPGDSQASTPLSRESLAGRSGQPELWKEFQGLWLRSPAFGMARDLGLDGLTQGLASAPSRHRGSDAHGERRTIILPWNTNGSVEHYYHFLLGYFLPLAIRCDKEGRTPFRVRDCGPMNRIFGEVAHDWMIEVMDPGEHLEESSLRSASYVVGMDASTRYDPEKLRAAAAVVRDALGVASNAEVCGNVARILVVSRGEPDPFYSVGSAEIATSGTDRRSIPNLSDVATALADLGIVTICALERATLAEQVQAFQAADIVVAQHGAALANLVWCRSGTGVVQVDPTGTGHVFSRLSEALGCEHVLIVQESVHAPVDPTAVRGSVEQLLRNRVSTE
jgi:hypothetical protein